MTEYERVKEEAIFRCCSEINGDKVSCKQEFCSGCTFKIPHLKEAVTSILSLVEIKSDDQSLPEIPEFQYDIKAYRPYLKRGAINYSKMLVGFIRVIPKPKRK